MSGWLSTGDSASAPSRAVEAFESAGFEVGGFGDTSALYRTSLGLSWAEGLAFVQRLETARFSLNLQASASSLDTVKPVEMHQRLPDADKTSCLLVGWVAPIAFSEQ